MHEKGSILRNGFSLEHFILSRRLLVRFSVLILITVQLCITLIVTPSYAYTGGAGGGQSEAPSCPNPPCGTGGSDNRQPYWVFFRIKNSAERENSANAWTIANQDVSACAITEGVYFSFQSEENNSNTVSQSLSSMPYDGFDSRGNCGYGGCAIVMINRTTHKNVHKVDSSVYNSNVFEPEYILMPGQTSDSSIKVHHVMTDLNGDGEINGRYIWEDRPNDITLYIADKWDKNVRLKWYEGNNYYYNENDPLLASRIGRECYSWDGNAYANACKILSIDGSGYSHGERSGLSNYYNGNNGKRRTGVAKAEWASHVNVSWFCGGGANGTFTGNPDGEVVRDATEQVDKKTYSSTTKTTTKYYEGSNREGKYRIKFTHAITRTDTDSNRRLKPSQQSTIRTNNDANTDETFISRLEPGETNTQERYIDIDLGAGESKKICQTLTYETQYSDGASTGSTDKKTICVVIEQSTALTSGSASYVHNDIEQGGPVYTGGNETVESWGGSRGEAKVYHYMFTHKLKLEGKTGYAYDMKYYIVQTRNGVTEFTTDQKTVRINSGHNHYTTVYTSDRTAWNAIGPGETTPTICQTIYFKPKKITIDIANNTTTTSGGWQNSTICTKVRRREASQIKLSAKSKVLVNGVSNPTETQVSTNAHTFKFSFNITTPNDRKLKTTYTIQRIIFESDEQENWSNAETVKGPREITAPNTSAITNSFTLNPESGKTYKVCERIRLEPDKYQIEYNANNTEEGVYALASHGNYAKRCTKVGWPGQKVRDDGVITVHSSSKGKINADYHSGTDSYIMKGEKATITYTHTLWRDAEKHKNGNKADVKSPKEDVTVSYRLDVSENSYSVRNFSIKNNPDNLELPTVTIPTNSKENPKIIESNKNSIFTNANITATAEKVGKIYSYCQSINYFSSKHTLRGKYLEVDGEIYDPKMIAALPPEARPATVGQSKPGCVNVLRPYNFNVNKITIENSPSGAIVSGGEEAPDISFRIHVSINNKDYMLTDVPKARIQFVKFILKDSPKDANLSGKAIEESPCNYFKAQIGTVYFKSCDDTTSYETKTISNNAFKDSGDVAYYKSKDKYSVVYKADTGTIDNSLQGSDKVCYALAVKATNSDKSGQVGYGATKSEFDNRWTVSDAACVNLGKRPTVQVWGGSTFTSGGIRTSITKTNGKTFGSWDDYLIIANSGIKNMSSGAYLISGATDASYCSRSPLTIANSNCGSKKLGNARINTTYSLIEGIYSYYIRSTNKEFADIKDEPLDNGSHYIDSGVLNKAVTKYPILIYNSDPDHKDIYIKNNIDLGLADRRYTDTNVPQVIIYSKGDIYIEPAIKRIDAWILAEGDIYTCATGKDNKRVRINTGASACDIQLTISGPIVANTIYFDRTANGEVGANTITQPAEIVDLNPGLYLFGYNETSSQTQPITTYIQKLAPRY